MGLQSSERIDAWGEFYSLKDFIIEDYFITVKNKEKYVHKYEVIKPTMYKRALQDFMKFGKITRYPEKHLYRWKDIVIQNTAYLSAMTEIAGHTQYFPYDILNEIFETNINDFCEACELLDDDDSFPTWSNGQNFISDYALNPMEKILDDLMVETDPTKILILINKALDIIHMRSDFAELFIKGGNGSLYAISNEE